MDDWEDDQIPHILAKEQPKNAWDDEDEDEDDVKESWEDGDEPTTAPAPAHPIEKVTKKVDIKPNEKQKNIAEVKEVPLDPIAEKFVNKGYLLKCSCFSDNHMLVEEADYHSTTELFAKIGVDNTLGNFIPKSESDFLEYAELISYKLCPYEKSFHYVGLLKAVMRLSMTHLNATDSKDVATSVTAIVNEKLKLEKEANAGKKKTGTKKKQLHVDKPDDDIVVAAHDEIDEDDFM